MRVEEEFWKWFQEHGSDLLKHSDAITSLFLYGDTSSLKTPSESLDQVALSLGLELRNLLDLIHPHLGIELKSPSELDSSSTKGQLIFTTQGDREAIPFVTQLVNFAPILNQWQIIPFRPRQKFCEGVQYESVNLKPEQLHFHYEKLKHGCINLDLYCEEVEGLQKENTEALCHKLLELALGEFDLYHRIEELHIHLMSDPQSPHLLPFIELVEVVDSLKKARV